MTGLKEVDRMKTEFLMTASHELKSPLTSIGMSLDLLREELGVSVEEKNRELVEAACEEVKRLKALGRPSRSSKIEAGKIEMELEEVSASWLIERSTEVIRKQVEEKGIRFSSSVPADGVRVRADGNKIVWVLTNLMANAIRYTKAGGEIELSAVRIGGWVHYSVRDTGSGIPTEYQSRIFDKFVQVKSPESAGGSGLGLSICKEIVRAHGGTIWVESEADEGSRFTFTVPLAEETRENR